MSDIYKSIPDSLIKAAKGVMEQNTDLRAEQELASHGFSINEKNDYLETDLKKRKKNNDKAIKDMKKMGSPMKNPAFGEEVEQIDELSKKTLGSYIKKASKDARRASYASGIHHADGNYAHGEKTGEKALKRQRGVNTAVNKLTKEEQEFIDSLNNDIPEDIEIAEANYYIATSEKSKFHDKGYRPHLKNPQGKTSYLASVAYKSHEHAAGEAAAYHKGYTSGPGKASERGANDAVRAYRHKNKEHMHEEVELDDVDPKALKMKFKNRKDKDIDNDGDVDDSDKYLHKRRKAISKNIDEEAEQIDEISRKTLRSYINKSGESMKQKGRGRPSRAFSAKKAKRSAGIETAKRKINDKNEKEWDEMEQSRENTISTVHSYILNDGPKKAGYSKFNSSGDRTIFVKKGPNGHLLYLEVYNNADKYSGRFGKLGNSGSSGYDSDIYVNDLVPWKLRGNSDPKQGIEQFNKLIKQNEKVRD
jgi:hypothetical protein